MPRVLLLATTTGYQTRAFGDAAERLGVELVFATDRCNVLDDPWQDAAIPIRFHETRKSVDAIVAAARARPLDGILVVGDRPTLIAAEVARVLGLPGHPRDAVIVARDKRRFRERLQASGLPVPWFMAVPINVDVDEIVARVPFPCVVKPIALSGSRGVMRADGADEFREAMARLRRLMLTPEIRAERTPLHDVVLVERFIEGREFAFEAVFHEGRLHAFALFDKPDPLDGPFFEETIYVTPSRASEGEQRAIERAIADAAGAIGLWHGPIHAECRLSPPGPGRGPEVFVLEIAARPIGGLCARALRVAKPANGDGDRFVRTTGEIVEEKNDRRAPVNDFQRNDSRPHFPANVLYEEFLLRQALGESPAGWQRERAASGVMMIPIPARGIYRDVAGVDAARAVAGVDEVRITAKPDQLLVPLPEGASYLGFIFAHGDTPAAVEQALRAAHGTLAFAIDPELRVVQSVHG